jgi:hypothetical protein
MGSVRRRITRRARRVIVGLLHHLDVRRCRWYSRRTRRRGHVAPVCARRSPVLVKRSPLNAEGARGGERFHHLRRGQTTRCVRPADRRTLADSAGAGRGTTATGLFTSEIREGSCVARPVQHVARSVHHVARPVQRVVRPVRLVLRPRALRGATRAPRSATPCAALRDWCPKPHDWCTKFPDWCTKFPDWCTKFPDWCTKFPDWCTKFPDWCTNFRDWCNDFRDRCAAHLEWNAARSLS